MGWNKKNWAFVVMKHPSGYQNNTARGIGMVALWLEGSANHQWRLITAQTEFPHERFLNHESQFHGRPLEKSYVIVANVSLKEIITILNGSRNKAQTFLLMDACFVIA